MSSLPQSPLSSFVSSNQYTKENLTFPFIAGMKVGSTYVAPIFSGPSGAANKDIGGLYGKLIYSRTNLNNPIKGNTNDPYIVYNDPYEMVSDLNQLRGITYALLSGTGYTWTLFQNINNTIVPTNEGFDFLNALHCLAYGGTLVLVPETSGFDEYSSNLNRTFDVVLDANYNRDVVRWLEDQPYTVGIFPSIPEDGLTGAGATLPPYDSLFTNSSFVSGSTIAGKLFTIRGIKSINVNTQSLQNNSTLTTQLTAVNDVAGFFARSKNRNESYLTVAGIERSTIINGSITNTINWEDSLRTILRSNRVNFFVNNQPSFLGSDVVGGTASSVITVNDRIGPIRLRADMTKTLNNILMQYVFDINNATTRSQIVTAVETSLQQYTPFLDNTATQIICNNSNNQDNSSTLALDVIAKPILGTELFTINITFTS